MPFISSEGQRDPRFVASSETSVKYENISILSARPFVVPIVSDAELDNPEFLRDLRIFAANLRVSRGRWLDWLADGYRDADAILVDDCGDPADVDLELLELDGIEWWFKDWCKRPPAGITPRLRIEARERVRVVATLLRLIFPKESIVWGVSGEAACRLTEETRRLLAA